MNTAIPTRTAVLAALALALASLTHAAPTPMPMLRPINPKYKLVNPFWLRNANWAYKPDPPFGPVRMGPASANLNSEADAGIDALGEGAAHTQTETLLAEGEGAAQTETKTLLAEGEGALAHAVAAAGGAGEIVHVV